LPVDELMKKINL